MQVKTLGSTLGYLLLCSCFQDHGDLQLLPPVSADASVAAAPVNATSETQPADVVEASPPPIAAVQPSEPADDVAAVVAESDDAGVDEPGKRALSVSTFSRATCALLEDATVRCWGENTTGSLGDGTFTDSARPVKVKKLQQVVQLDVGLKRACAVVDGGALRCWGDNGWEELRNGNRDNQNTAVLAQGVAHVAEVSLGESQTCIRRTDNTLECWSYDGNPVLAALQVKGVTDVVSVEAGYFLTTAVLVDGSVRTWGGNPLAGTVDVAASRSVGSGYGFVCVVTPDASVRCQGLYSVHEVVERVDGIVPGLSSVANMSCGFEHSCAVTQEGKVYCWGRNNRGQLGDGSTEYTGEAHEVVGLDQVVEVTCGREHSCARKADGTVHCWGSNDKGELGDGTTTERRTPVPVIGL